MSGFKDMVADDIRNVFLDTDEFAESHNVEYDGKIYRNIPVILTGLKEQNRRQLENDHVQGLYLASTVMRCAAKDLKGNVPEKGTKIKINDGRFLRTFYIASSDCELGMVYAELEAIDE
jgi:hypothetical protein